MVRAVEASLKRLQTDYIDLYCVHIGDQITPVQEVMRGLDDLVRQGKVIYVGISLMPQRGGSLRRIRLPTSAGGHRSWACKSSTA
jgi:aryl-alcohol dehydrogenase-like predicted oxidoreductase